MKSLTVICPVYNEEQVIAEFHSALKSVLDGVSTRYDYQILFVVDQCTDNTIDILRRIAKTDSRLRILVLSSRFGHQMSLLAGIDHASSDAIVMLDSDLQHPPDLIPAMLDEFERGYDIVYTIREEAGRRRTLRALASRVFYGFVNLISDTKIEENAADFRLISRRVADVFRKQIRERNQFIRGLIGWVGFKRVGLRFTVNARGGGQSKYSLMRLMRFAMEGFVSFSKRPLVAAIFVGFTFAFLGLALAVVTLVQWVYYKDLPSGWTTLVILISGYSGVQLIFLGIIGYYIGAIVDEVKARPHYIVEEKLNFGEQLGGHESATADGRRNPHVGVRHVSES